MHLRKKLHEDLLDNEEDYCPRRKIKKLDTVSDLSQKIFQNSFIVRHLLQHVLATTDHSQTVLDNLQLRLVSKTFNEQILGIVRAEFVKVQVSPHRLIDDEESEEESDDVDSQENRDRPFLINDRIVRYSNADRFFGFLNTVARVRILDLVFAGFTHFNQRLHDVILHKLISVNWFFVVSYKGAEEVCPGCSMCNMIASRARYLGPLQFRTLSDPIPGRKHYRQLIITELLLADIAFHCVTEISNRQEAFARLKSLITPDITCDQLDLVFSDRVMWEKHTPAHPREVIDCILTTWRIKTVNIRFITGYSSVKYEMWAGKRIFTQMRFDEKFIAVPLRTSHFKRVEVDMQAGDEIATCFAESMGLFESNGLSATAFQNVCANIKRVFPNQEMFLVLPVELASVAALDLHAFCMTLLEFAWKDERTSRHSRLYFRLFTFGITEEDVKGQIAKNFRLNSRPVLPALSSDSDSFLNWMPGTTSSFERHLLSFTDTINNCVVHLEVCIEPPL